MFFSSFRFVSFRFVSIIIRNFLGDRKKCTQSKQAFFFATKTDQTIEWEMHNNPFEENETEHREKKSTTES